MTAKNQRDPAVSVQGLRKRFTLHTQGGAVLPVLDGIRLDLYPAQCIALHGPSGSGKSSLIRAIYGNYRVSEGAIFVRHDERAVDIARACPRILLDIRRRTLGYVSQFLRVIPRVSTLDVVMEPLLSLGVTEGEARSRAAHMLTHLRIPDRLWTLAPATFSGGEQQRVNLAHGFVAEHPILLLDEPTASLDMANRDAVIELIREARDRGTAILGIFHDDAIRERVADLVYAMPALEDAA